MDGRLPGRHPEGGNPQRSELLLGSPKSLRSDARRVRRPLTTQKTFNESPHTRRAFIRHGGSKDLDFYALTIGFPIIGNSVASHRFFLAPSKHTRSAVKRPYAVSPPQRRACAVPAVLYRPRHVGTTYFFRTFLVFLPKTAFFWQSIRSFPIGNIRISRYNKVFRGVPRFVLFVPLFELRPFFGTLTSSRLPACRLPSATRLP